MLFDITLALRQVDQQDLGLADEGFERVRLKDQRDVCLIHFRLLNNSVSLKYTFALGFRPYISDKLKGH